MQDRIQLSGRADWILHRDPGWASLSPELRSSQPLLRVGRESQQTTVCEAAQDSQQDQN